MYYNFKSSDEFTNFLLVFNLQDIEKLQTWEDDNVSSVFFNMNSQLMNYLVLILDASNQIHRNKQKNISEVLINGESEMNYFAQNDYFINYITNGSTNNIFSVLNKTGIHYINRFYQEYLVLGKANEIQSNWLIDHFNSIRNHKTDRIKYLLKRENIVLDRNSKMKFRSSDSINYEVIKGLSDEIESLNVLLNYDQYSPDKAKYIIDIDTFFVEYLRFYNFLEKTLKTDGSLVLSL